MGKIKTIKKIKDEIIQKTKIKEKTVTQRSYNDMVI